MKIRINPRRITTVLMTAYLMNVFYFSVYETAQKLLFWALVAVYLMLNIRTFSKILNKLVIHFTGKKNVLLLILLWGFIILLTPLIHGTHDFSYFGEYISIIVAILNYLVICVRIYNTEGEDGLLVKFMLNFIYLICNFFIYLT